MKIWHLDTEYQAFINAVTQTRESRKAGVREIVEGVKSELLAHGNQALVAFGRKFDGWTQDYDPRVSRGELEQAAASVDKADLDVLKGMIENVTAYHRSQKPIRRTYKRQGLQVTEEAVPVDRVCVYVPGGTATYPSSLVMGAVPAKIAGVKEIYATTPTHDGRIDPYVAAAALLLDIKDVYRIGGAQAVYAFSFGIAGVPRVDMIVGPGNAYVEEAKRDVYGQVGIDMLAGPSELVILAASSFPPEAVAWDLFSQAEHDTMATVGLFCPSLDDIYALMRNVERLLASNKRRAIVDAALKNAYLVHYSNLDNAVRAIELIAPEHLEVLGDEAAAERISFSGVTYVGPYTCVAMGDYYIGTNHVLPTGGAGRFSSGLSVERFTKRKVLVKIDRQFVAKYGARAARLAEIEGLYAHAEAIRQRAKELSE